MKTRQLQLTREKVALVDEDIFDELNKHAWHFVDSGRGSGYAGRMVGRDLRYLHHDVLGVPSSTHVDHRNRIGLDCRRENLRVATKSLNGANRDKFVSRTGRGFTSQYKGVVSRHAHANRADSWLVRIRVQGTLIHIGYYHTEHEGAVAYDCAAIHHFGEFAKTNFNWSLVA